MTKPTHVDWLFLLNIRKKKKLYGKRLATCIEIRFLIFLSLDEFPCFKQKDLEQCVHFHFSRALSNENFHRGINNVNFFIEKRCCQTCPITFHGFSNQKLLTLAVEKMGRWGTVPLLYCISAQNGCRNIL